MSSEPIELHKRRASAKASVEVFRRNATVEKCDGRSMFIVDSRVFARDCLAAAFRSAHTGRSIEVFSGVQDLRANRSPQVVPSVVLLGFNEMGGKATPIEEELHDLMKEMPAAPVVLISDVNDPKLLGRALEAGARGFIPSNLPLKVVLQALEVVEAGGTYLPVETYLTLQRAANEPVQAAVVDTGSLTSRQWSVLQALRQGKANKVIALELSMRESTVKVHVRNIMKKLNARNRTEVSFKTNALFSDTGNASREIAAKPVLRAIAKPLLHA